MASSLEQHENSRTLEMLLGHGGSRLSECEQFLSDIIENAVDLFIIADKSGNVQYVSPKVNEIIKYKEDEVRGRPFHSFIAAPDDGKMAKDLELAAGGKTVTKTEYRFKRADRSLAWLSIDMLPIAYGGNAVNRIALVCRDITEEKRHKEKVKYGKTRDGLTGLYNRAYFNMALERVQDEDIVDFGFIMADLNGLKLINNTFGYQKGDEMVVEAANLLKDVCDEKCEVIRMGGGEFTILVYNCTQDDLDGICDGIRRECAKFADRIIPLSISSGTSLRQDVNQSIRVLYRQAEGAMYSEKSLDNNSIHNQVMTSLSETLKVRNVESAEHRSRVGKMAAAMGKRIGLTSAEYDRLLLLAMMHDIGEIAVPDSIMHKEDALDDEEWMIMRTHCEVGCRIAMTSNELSFIANEICCHHERWDGAGYPYGYKGEEIPLLSRIVSVVDAYDALTHEKVYKAAIAHSDAVEELRRSAGTQLDPTLVEVFMELFKPMSDAQMKDMFAGISSAA